MYIDKDFLLINVGQSELTEASDFNEGSIENTAKIEQSINMAEAYMNAKLSQAYILPVRGKDGSIPPLLQNIAVALTRMEYFQNRATEEIIIRCREARSQLNLIIQGKLDIIGLDGIIVNRILSRSLNVKLAKVTRYKAKDIC
jgi:phage gp36-like protein